MGHPKSNTKASQYMYKPKRAKRIHDPEVVRLAIESVRTRRYSLRKAAKAFNIPVSTLSEKLEGKYPVEPVHFTLLTTEEEVTVLACMSAAGRFVNPLIVYPYKRLPSNDLTRDFP
ncbi:alanine--tRNA ligase, partial [Elysia marginata]